MTIDQLANLITADTTIEQIQADPRTARAINIVELKRLLTLTYPVIPTAEAMLESPDVPDQAKGGIRTMLAILNEPRLSVIGSNESADAASMASILGLLASLQLIGDTERAAILALGGGMLFAGVDADQLAAAKAKKIRREAANAWDSGIDTLRLIRDRYVAHGDIALPTLPGVPDGFAVVEGQLQRL